MATVTNNTKPASKQAATTSQSLIETLRKLAGLTDEQVASLQSKSAELRAVTGRNSTEAAAAATAHDRAKLVSSVSRLFASIRDGERAYKSPKPAANQRFLTALVNRLGTKLGIDGKHVTILVYTTSHDTSSDTARASMLATTAYESFCTRVVRDTAAPADSE